MKSMTGYGTAEGEVGRGRLFIEVKAVNHRFCDINIKIPPKMGVLESYIKKFIENRYIRGKFDVFVKEIKPLFGEMELTVDIDLAKKYQHGLRKLIHTLNLKCSDEFLHYVSLDHFVALKEKEGSYEKLWKEAGNILALACEHVDRMRNREGRYLQIDQQKRIAFIKRLVSKIKKFSFDSIERNKARVRRRMEEFGPIDEQRLATEVAFIGSRQDIAEEVTRLESHIEQYNKLVLSRGSVGRKLDFLLQEINREVNTIGSKAADVRISQLVVECKTELERLREQVQNVE
jgi:uncharacterized protein (TIGR00255 family)